MKLQWCVNSTKNMSLNKKHMSLNKICEEKGYNEIIQCHHTFHCWPQLTQTYNIGRGQIIVNLTWVCFLIEMSVSDTGLEWGRKDLYDSWRLTGIRTSMSSDSTADAAAAAPSSRRGCCKVV